jgi:hypothetical protein
MSQGLAEAGRVGSILRKEGWKGGQDWGLEKLQ